MSKSRNFYFLQAFLIRRGPHYEAIELMDMTIANMFSNIEDEEVTHSQQNYTFFIKKIFDEDKITSLRVKFIKRTPEDDLPDIHDIKTKAFKQNVKEVLEDDDMLVNAGRFIIYNSGRIVIEFRKDAGGFSSPIKALLGLLSKKINKKLDFGPLVDPNGLLSYLQRTHDGEVEIKLISPDQILKNYDASKIATKNKGTRIIMDFRDGRPVVDWIKSFSNAITRITKIKHNNEKVKVSDASANIYLKPTLTLDNFSDHAIFERIDHLYQVYLPSIESYSIFYNSSAFRLE